MLDGGIMRLGFNAMHLVPRLDSLPPELIEAVAGHVCREHPLGPPTPLIDLLCVSRRFYSILGPSNEGFYADLFKERFDSEAPCRRWDMLRKIEQDRSRRAGTFFSTDPATTHQGMHGLGKDSPWGPLTSASLASEFKRRCTVLTKLRRAVTTGVIVPTTSVATTPKEDCPPTIGLQAFRPQRAPVPDEVTLNLWTCYLMLTEADEKNVEHLRDYALLPGYMSLFYRHSLLGEALRPGWPRESIGGGLGLWCGWLGSEDEAEESAEESEEHFFVLKPYVFGAHKFDSFMQPWTLPALPLPVPQDDLMTRTQSPYDPFFANLQPRHRAQAITYMGRSMPMVPPILAHAAIFSFFYRVERDPSMSTADGLDQAVFPGPVNGPASGLLGNMLPMASFRPPKTAPPPLESRIHDRDFARLASCIDPYTSPGLPSLFCKGMMEGSWEGRFSFFDFDSYRDMLSGRMKSLYEGPFGDQPQVWRLEEKVVKVNRGERPGGKGPALNAGYLPGERPPKMRGSPPSFTTSLAPEGEEAEEEETAHVAKKARSWSEDDDLDIEDDFPEWEEDASSNTDDYEILLTGSGHSAWGQFVLKGRIRAWDGMFTIAKEYTPDGRGRWLYRGYCVAGALIGRWRDTHTPVELSGYEGTFVMMRRGP